MEGLSLPIPPLWSIAGVLALWIAVLLYFMVGRSLLLSSHNLRRLQRATTSEDEETSPDPFESQLLGAGLYLGPRGRTRFRLLQLASLIVTWLLTAMMGLPGLLALTLGCVAPVALQIWVSTRFNNRAREIDRELPMALTRIAGLLPVQPDVAEVLRVTAATLKTVNPSSALAGELDICVAESRSIGETPALQNLERRAPSPSLASVAFSLRSYAQAGGSFTQAMAAAAQRTTALLESRNHARAKAGDAMNAARMLPVLLLLITVFLFRDPVYNQIYRGLGGQLLLIGAGLLMALGMKIINDMVNEVA